MISVNRLLPIVAVVAICPSSALKADKSAVQSFAHSTDLATEKVANWPHWGGPNADGVADGMDLPIHWSPAENHRWSAKLPGWGTSSPVVYDNAIARGRHPMKFGVLIAATDQRDNVRRQGPFPAKHVVSTSLY